MLRSTTSSPNPVWLAGRRWRIKLPRFNADALIYCIAWAALAIIGWDVGGMRAGLLLSVGLFLIVMPTSAVVLSRTGSFRLERGIRWGILVVAALALFSFADIGAA